MPIGRSAAIFAMIPLLVIPMLISVGQILFKKASQTGGLVQTNAFLSFFSNPYLFVALTIYLVATFWWVIALRTSPLSHAYIFMALSFVYVPALSWLLLRETLGWRAVAGSVLIVLGIAIAASRPAAPAVTADQAP